MRWHHHPISSWATIHATRRGSVRITSDATEICHSTVTDSKQRWALSISTSRNLNPTPTRSLYCPSTSRPDHFDSIEMAAKHATIVPSDHGVDDQRDGSAFTSSKSVVGRVSFVDCQDE